MLEHLPLSVSLLFGLTVVLTLVGFSLAIRSKGFLVVAIGWIALQSFLGLKGVFLNTEAMPPRLMLMGVLPALGMIAVTFATPQGRRLIKGMNLQMLTYFHAIRIPVEIVLFMLFTLKVMPVNLTFEGTNFDIISGVSAILIGILAFRPGKTNISLLVIWNVLCLLLLLNVVITAIFSIPSPFQKLAFDQPNIAVLYFPFCLLPTFIVPLVLFAHLAAFWRLRAR